MCCHLKKIKGSQMDVCIAHGALVWKGQKECEMAGKFRGDLKGLLRELGGGNVKMDCDGEVVWVRGKEWIEKGSIWEKVWVMEWKEVEDGLWEVKKVKVRSEARW
jgi:hypothetical protein